MLDHLPPRLSSSTSATTQAKGPLCDLALAARAQRDPVRRRLRGRHARSSSATRRRRRRSIRARSRTSRGAACKAMTWSSERDAELDDEFARRYDGRAVPRALEPGLDDATDAGGDRRASWTSTRAGGPRSSSRTSSGTRTCSSGATSSPTRRSGSSRRCARRARTTASTGSSSSIRRTSGSGGATASPASSTSTSRSGERIGELPPHVTLLEPDTRHHRRGRSSASPTSA